MNKSDMLENLINYYTEGNKARFASMLGVKAQNISAWIARNTFDAELIYSKCNGVSADWLLSGQGEMLSDKRTVEKEPTASNNQPKELLILCKALVVNYQQRDEVMNKLVSMVKEI